MRKINAAKRSPGSAPEILVVTRDEALRLGLSAELSAQGLGVRCLNDIGALKSALAARLPSFLISTRRSNRLGKSSAICAAIP